MTDDEWEEQRRRAILTAFQTGRPVFADNRGVLHYADGDREDLSTGDGVIAPSTPYTKAMRASRAAFVSSLATAAINVVVGFWHPWYFAFALVMLSSALIWHRVHRGQRALYGARK